MNGFRLISVWQVPLLVIWVTNVGGGGWFIVKLCVSGASAGHLGGMGRGIRLLSSSVLPMTPPSWSSGWVDGSLLSSVFKVPPLVFQVTGVGGEGWFVVELCVSGASTGHG